MPVRLLVLISLSAIRVASAHPRLLASSTCTFHPATALGPHGAPALDANTSIELLGEDGTAITTVCPGGTYTLQVTYSGEAREALLTSSAGATINSNASAACLNRLTAAPANRTTRATLRLDCTTTLPASGLTINVTSAKARADNFHFATATLPVGSACSAEVCATPSTSTPSASLSHAFTTTLHADYAQLAASNSTMAQFKQDFVTAAASALGLSTSQVHISDGSPRPGSINIDAIATASSAAAVTALDTALAQLQADPAAHLGAALLTTYGATGAVVQLTAASPATFPSPAAQHGLACAPSSLNYSCSVASGSVTIHWGLGVAAPTNGCTASISTAVGASGDAETQTREQLLHMAIEAPTSGYVGLGFGTGNRMTPSDVVLGWTDGSKAAVQTYNIPQGGYDFVNANNYLTPSWAVSRGLVQETFTSADGSRTTVTTLCFSRPLVAPAAAVSASLDASSTLSLVWAAASDGVTDLSAVHEGRGALTLNLATGAASDVGAYSRIRFVFVHAALMAAAWAVLLPLGTLAARHRWLLGEHKVFGLHTWFQLHRALQLTGTVVFLVGLVYAWVYLGIRPKGTPLRKAHGGVGTAVVATLLLQVLLAVIRPKPDAPRRGLWNLVHHNLGRVTLLLSWAALFLGAYLGYATPAYRMSLTAWMAPMAACIGVLLAADVALSVIAWRRCAAAEDAGVLQDQDAKTAGASAAGDDAGVTDPKRRAAPAELGDAEDGASGCRSSIDAELIVAPSGPSFTKPRAAVPRLQLSALFSNDSACSGDNNAPVSARNVILVTPRSSSRRLSLDSPLAAPSASSPSARLLAIAAASSHRLSLGSRAAVHPLMPPRSPPAVQGQPLTIIVPSQLSPAATHVHGCAATGAESPRSPSQLSQRSLASSPLPVMVPSLMRSHGGAGVARLAMPAAMSARSRMSLDSAILFPEDSSPTASGGAHSDTLHMPMHVPFGQAFQAHDEQVLEEPCTQMQGWLVVGEEEPPLVRAPRPRAPGGVTPAAARRASAPAIPAGAFGNSPVVWTHTPRD